MSRRRNAEKTSWAEFILLVLVILCIYLILALFDSSLAGEGGQEIGSYLRTSWGGAAVIPLLFVLYLCTAKFIKRRVPRVPRQILGTIQLYISFAFMLGLLREAGWSSEMTLFLPGNFGLGLARFFVLNAGMFITLLLVIASFILTAYLFGSRILKLELPSLPSFSFKSNSQDKPRRTRRRRENLPDEAAFLKNIPAPVLRQSPDDAKKNNFYSPEELLEQDYTPEELAFMKKIPAPILKSDSYNYSAPEPADIIPACSNTIEIIDNILAAINSGDLDAPARRRKSSFPRTKKIRRPLPDLTLSEEKNSPEIPANPQNQNVVLLPPPMELFGASANFEINERSSMKSFEKQGRTIISTLKNFGINASIAQILTGPSVIQYQLELAPGVKVSKVEGLDEEIAMYLAVKSVRIEAPISGTQYVGVEVPNPERKIAPLRNIFESQEFKADNSRLPLPVGVQADGKILVAGLEEMPHILIAGSKGSGRSMFINSCILSFCSARRPEELRLILIDPRHVEFAPYEGLPHLLASPIYEAQEALKALQWACAEMDKRTSDFARFRVRNLAAYNRKLQKQDRLPEIVIIIDELADLLYSGENEIESLILKLTQKAGNAGIYLMLAVQRPSADVVTALIKSNISARIAFTLSSENEAKNFGLPDALKLTGKGDLLFRSANHQQILRLQAPFINEEKISDFVEYMTGGFAQQDYMKF